MSKILLCSIALFGMAVAVSSPAELDAKTCKAASKIKLDTKAAEAGRKIFIACSSCHELGRGKSARIGPPLGAMFDGKPLAATYSYSKAFRDAAPNWRDTQKLDAFLAKPSAVVPGTKMVFAGIARPEDRRNLIAYLKSEAAKTSCR